LFPRIPPTIAVHATANRNLIELIEVIGARMRRQPTDERYILHHQVHLRNRIACLDGGLPLRHDLFMAEAGPDVHIQRIRNMRWMRAPDLTRVRSGLHEDLDTQVSKAE